MATPVPPRDSTLTRVAQTTIKLLNVSPPNSLQVIKYFSDQFHKGQKGPAVCAATQTEPEPSKKVAATCPPPVRSTKKCATPPSKLGTVLLSWNGAKADITTDGSKVVCAAGVTHKNVREWIDYEQQMFVARNTADDSSGSGIEFGYVDLGLEENMDYDPLDEDALEWNSNEYWMQRLNAIVSEDNLDFGFRIIHQASKILKHVYLSSLRNISPSMLQGMNFTRILVCETESSRGSTESTFNDEKFGSFLVKTIVCRDEASFLEEHFDQVKMFLDGANLLKEKAIIACEDGINYGPALAIAYMMVRDQLNLVDAVKHIKFCRLHGPVLWSQALQLELIKFGRRKELLV